MVYTYLESRVGCSFWIFLRGFAAGCKKVWGFGIYIDAPLIHCFRKRVIFFMEFILLSIVFYVCLIEFV